MIAAEHSKPGERVEVQRLSNEPRHAAKVVALPFIDPKKDIPKQRVQAS